jgi:hypothetical protein
LKIDKLKGRLESIGTGDDAELERNTVKDEITDLEALQPDLIAKLEEVNEQDQQLVKEAKEALMSSLSGTNGAGETAAAANINGAEFKDITSMVKSKRKINDEVAGGEANQKKTRLSEENCETIGAAATVAEVPVEAKAEEVKMDETPVVAAAAEAVTAEPTVV